MPVETVARLADVHNGWTTAECNVRLGHFLSATTVVKRRCLTLTGNRPSRKVARDFEGRGGESWRSVSCSEVVRRPDHFQELWPKVGSPALGSAAIRSISRPGEFELQIFQQLLRLGHRWTVMSIRKGANGIRCEATSRSRMGRADPSRSRQHRSSDRARRHL